MVPGDRAGPRYAPDDVAREQLEDRLEGSARIHRALPSM